MPLTDAETPPSIDTTHYVVYFSSGTPPWCPYCVDIEPALQQVFGPDSAPSASIVRVGTREEWRGNQKNKYRHEPYNIQGVPTVVRVENGKEVARIDEFDSEPEAQLKKLIA